MSPSRDCSALLQLWSSGISVCNPDITELRWSSAWLEKVYSVDTASVHIWSAPWSPLRLWKSPLSSAHAFSGEKGCDICLHALPRCPEKLVIAACWPRTQPVTVAWAPPEGGAADLRASQGPSAAGPSCNSNNFREEGKKKKAITFWAEFLQPLLSSLGNLSGTSTAVLFSYS